HLGADLLGAAGDYGKLDDKAGVGQYLDKAEKYLHQYETTHHTTTGGAAPANAPPAGEPAVKKDDGDSGSGFGDYMKMAQGFMKK
ncbi:PREDICTED: nodulin-related protein 1, partial [Tarenaya hassleriana]|uniref:nodulin-related protein 1 n=1 Tax=Tarenaya hassleriana TaxID=28532 RepID=UPI00053C5A0D